MDVVDVGRIDLQNIQTGRRSDRVERVERAGRETRVLLLLEDTRRGGERGVFDDAEQQRAFARLGFVRSTAVRPSVWGVFGDVVVVVVVGRGNDILGGVRDGRVRRGRVDAQREIPRG